MYLNINNNIFVQIKKDLILKIFSCAMILNFIVMALFLPVASPVTLPTGNLLQVQSNNGSTNPVDPQVKNTVFNELNKFSEGFVKQGSSGDPSIQYFIKNSGIEIGFGNSLVKMLIKSDQNKGNPSYSQVSITFPNSNNVDPTVKDPFISSSKYFIGSNVGTTKQEYQILIYKNIYNHIDLEYTLENGNLKYNFYVYPGGNVNNIQMKWNGPVSMEHSVQGMQITVNTNAGQKVFLDKQPVSYQGSKSVDVLTEFNMMGKNTYGFAVRSYDANSLLVIDPEIVSFSTYVSGLSSDYASRIVIDKNNNIYVTGYTYSSNFPMVNAYNNTFGNSQDIFVYKMSSDGQTLLYSTYVGGSNSEQANAIAIDANGNVYVTGYTYSNDFPKVNAYNSTFGLSGDVFVFKLSATGNSLLYSTYIGGNNFEQGTGIAVDGSGNAYITGQTYSLNFPLVNAYQTAHAQYMYQPFVCKLSSSGNSLAYSTYVGGLASSSYATDIAVDSTGNAYVTGYTYASDFPTLNAYGATFKGYEDVFVFKLASSGSSLLYSNLIGGKYYAEGHAITLDSSGNAYVTGFTSSPDFPTVSAYSNLYHGNTDSFIFKLSSSGYILLYSTYFGGSSNDFGTDIAIDSSGNAFITGYTYSPDLPMINAYSNKYSNNEDMFIAEFSSTGSSLLYSTFFGGSSQDQAFGIALDSNNNFYVVGITYSLDFPTINAYKSTSSGSQDSFILKFNFTSTLSSDYAPNQEAIVVSNTTKSLELFWNAPSKLDAFMSYNIYRGSSSGSYSLIGTSTTEHFVDDSISTGVTYYYAITTVYSFGEGPYSNEMVGVLATVPSAPTIQVKAGNNSVYINWNAPSDGGSPILEYQIFRGYNSNQYSFVGVTTDLFFNDTALSGGTKYYYVVAAVNSVGKGAYSQELTSTPLGTASHQSSLGTVTVTVTNSGANGATTDTSNSQSSEQTTSGIKNSPGFEVLSVFTMLAIISIVTIVNRKRR